MDSFEKNLKTRFNQETLPRDARFLKDLRGRLHAQAHAQFSQESSSRFSYSMFKKLSFASFSFLLLLAVVFSIFRPLSDSQAFLARAQEVNSYASDGYIVYQKTHASHFSGTVAQEWTAESWSHPDGSYLLLSSHKDTASHYLNLVDDKNFHFFYQAPDEADMASIPEVMFPPFCNVMKEDQGDSYLVNLEFAGGGEPSYILEQLNEEPESDALDESELPEIDTSYRVDEVEAQRGEESSEEIVQRLLTEKDWDHREEIRDGKKVEVFSKKVYGNLPGYDIDEFVFDAETYKLLRSGNEASDGSYYYYIDYLDLQLIPLDQKAEIFNPDRYGFILSSATNNQALSVLDIRNTPEGCYDFYGQPLDAKTSDALLNTLPADFFTKAFEERHAREHAASPEPMRVDF